MLRIITILSLLCISVSALSQSKLERDFGLALPPTSTTSPEAVSADWAGFPITVQLSVGQERYVTFFDAIQQVAVKPEIQQATGLLEYEVYGNNLMLRLNEDIATRIKVVMGNGIIVPIDLVIASGTNNQFPIVLRAPDTQEKMERRRVYTLSAKRASSGRNTAVDAIKYAFQRFYSPERLQEGMNDFESIALAKPKNLKLYRTNRVSIKPLISWIYSGLFVTACEVKNRIDSPVSLDPRLLRGQFRMASFYQDKLDAKGNAGDETLLVIVSDAPFNDAIGIWGG